MATLLDTIEGKTIPEHRPCSRLVVNEDGWRFAASRLSAGSWTLLGLWGDIGGGDMAGVDEGGGGIAGLTRPFPGGRFSTLGGVPPPATFPKAGLGALFVVAPV